MSMKHRHQRLVAAVLAIKHVTLPFLMLSCVTMVSLARADVYVIANPTVELSAGDIRSVYGGEKLMATSIKLVPIDNAMAQTEFLNKVMALDKNEYVSIWTKKGFQDGLNPP